MAGDGPTQDVLVLGAGAAGLWCAEVAARGGRDVLVLEKVSRTGTKVLASGGSRCNLTTTLGPMEAAKLFGARGERFLRAGFQALPPAEVRARFEGWGVATEEAPLEKIFPASGNARDVRDALEGAARGAGARIQLDAGAVAVERGGGLGAGRSADGGTVRARALVLAVGGMSYPGTGTTGDGYPWLEALGLEVVTPVPALVPLSSPAPWVHELTGIAWQGAEVRLEDAQGRTLQRRARPVLFTHRGLSGPGAMDVSHHVARHAAAGAPTGSGGGAPSDTAAPTLRVDFFPDLDREALRGELVSAAGRPGAPRLQRALGDLATGPMPRRLFDALAGAAGLAPDVTVNGLDRSSRHGLVETMKGLEVPVDGTTGWDQAEVTAGGLSLREVNPRTMAVNRCPGLFVIGELLDLNGPIGGLSFQAAFATAQLAGEALAGEAPD